MRRICILVLSFIVALNGYAAFEPVYSRGGMVVSPEPNATKAGIEILRQGGNAFDAAVAVGFALAVTYPAAGNLGGGGFMVALKADGERFFLDFRESAPAAAARDMYLDEDGNLIDGLSTDTLLAVGVPGTAHGLITALEGHGALERTNVLAPAVKLAKDGFEVSYSLNRSLDGAKERLGEFESTRKVFYPDNQAPAFGSVFTQPDLAQTLERIADDGIDGFYQGRTADLFVAYMKANGGIITHDDLKGYRSKYREPVEFDYKEYRLITPNLPSSGGVTMGQILKLVEPVPLKEMGYHSAKYIHRIVEAERLAFADRNHHLGDADFVDVPLRRLLSDEYLEGRRGLMPLERAGDSGRVKPGLHESNQTTHYCVVDKDGNAVAVTYTLNNSYGMGAVADGAGFLLNNEMDDFSAEPGKANMYGLVQGEANAVAPGKRMLSSMTPTIVTKNGKFAFTMGTPGGPTIITTCAQIFLNIAEFGMNIREAIDAPRFHHQGLPDAILHEPFAFSPDTAVILKRMGHSLETRSAIGIAAGIQAMDDEVLAGYADGRDEGTAMGE